MEQSILQEVISIRNKLGAIIVAAEPKVGKEWKTFRRLVNAHGILQGIEIDKSAPMADDRQPTLPGMPAIKDNICPTCGSFDTCEFGVRKTSGVADCEGYYLKVPETAEDKKEFEQQVAGFKEVTNLQDLPEPLSPEEMERLSQIKDEVEKSEKPALSLNSFEVKTAEGPDEEHTVSMCGHTVNHKTLKGAVIYLFQELGYPCQTAKDLKAELLKLPESEKRDLIISFLDPEDEKKRKKKG